MIKFINYDGSYPNLCRGMLTIKFEDKLFYLKDILCSGGSVWFTSDWHEGEWTINEYKLPNELKSHISEITTLINEHVSYGCCGGCV